MGECIIAKTGMVPNTRKINGLPLSEDIILNDTNIMAGNGVNFDTLRSILTHNTVHTMGTQTNLDIVNDANYPYPYEILANADVSTAIGLANNGNWWIIKYFRNTENNGYGIQLALNHNTGIVCVRTATGGTWNAWQTIYTTGNLNPSAIGAAAANHTHTDEQISAYDGINSTSLRNILVNGSTKFLGRPGVTVLNNPNYPYPYEASVADYDSPSIGLGGGWWHIKYFRHIDNNGFGAQLALGLNIGNKMFFRTSNGTNWYPWQEVYHNGNLNSGIQFKTGIIQIPEMENPEGTYSIIIDCGVKANVLFLNANIVRNFAPSPIIRGISKAYLPMFYGRGYDTVIDFEWYDTSIKCTSNDLRGPMIDAHSGYAKYGAYDLRWAVLY